MLAPKSTLANWMNEFKRWCPSLRVLRFHGNKDERQALKDTVLVPGRSDEERQFDVVVTTYEMAILEKSTLSRFPWYYLVIDEAHRVKNENSQLAKVLRTFMVRFRLMLTGTPLQNNLHELWALLNFLLPDVFSSSDDFEEWFNLEIDDEGAKRQLVAQLHKILRPFMLRRLKKDVAKSIPPKKETLLYVGMSDMQRRMYKKILQRDMQGWLPGGNKAEQTGGRLANIAMQLRKTVNHPYLFDGVEDRKLDPMGPHVINNCGKMALLNKLLPRLKTQGSRVLLFSLMTRLLDIMEDYCNINAYKFCRIDGQTDYELRQEQIEAYNAPGSDIFIFLLSTRAGGLGINLQTADTVILYDSDWNPQVDLQAQDRAHRIGQTKTVHVYRLITENTIEEKIIERAEMKLRLDAAVIQSGRLSTTKGGGAKASKDDMKSAIRYGADTVFRSEGATITEDDIDAIIARGETKTEELNDKLKEHTKGDLMDFKLDGNSSLQEFEGQDFSLEAQKALEAQMNIDLMDAMTSGKRERKVKSYNEASLQTDIKMQQSSQPRSKRTKQPKVRPRVLSLLCVCQYVH